MDTFISEQSLPVLIILFLASLAALSKATDFLTDHAVILSKKFGISEMIIGATIVSLGTTLPELAISITAVLQASADLALGNAVGSVITNTALVLGVGSLAGSVPVLRNTSGRLLFLVSAIFILVFGSIRSWGGDFFYSDGHLPRLIGFLFLCAIPLYLSSPFWTSEKKIRRHESKEGAPIRKKDLLMEGSLILSCGAVVAFSAAVLISTISTLAARLGVSKAIIAGTVIAFGTSLPELSTTFTSARKGYGGLAMGNVLGASILNILLVLGVSISVSPGGLTVPALFYRVHFPIALSVVGILTYFIFNTRKMEISNREGLVLLAIYLFYLFFNLVA